MSATLIATVGASNANSFQTVEEIDAYYETRMPTSVADEWNDLSPDEKIGGAITATLWMTNLIVWSNFTTTVTQSLPWPRYGMWNRNGWSLVSLNDIPQEVKNAHAELSRVLALTDRTEELEQLTQGVASLKAGPIKIDFRNPSGRGVTDPSPPIIPDFIIQMLVPGWVEYVLGIPESSRPLIRA